MSSVSCPTTEEAGGDASYFFRYYSDEALVELELLDKKLQVLKQSGFKTKEPSRDISGAWEEQTNLTLQIRDTHFREAMTIHSKALDELNHEKRKETQSLCKSLSAEVQRLIACKEAVKTERRNLLRHVDAILTAKGREARSAAQKDTRQGGDGALPEFWPSVDIFYRLLDDYIYTRRRQKAKSNRIMHKLSVREDYAARESRNPKESVVHNYFSSVIGKWVDIGEVVRILPGNFNGFNLRIVLDARYDEDFLNRSGNGLMMYPHVKDAYDAGCFAIVPKTRGQLINWKIVVLHRESRGIGLFSERAGCLCLGDVDGQVLKFETDYRPSATLLFLRYFATYMFGNDQVRTRLEDAMTDQDKRFLSSALDRRFLQQTASRLCTATVSWESFDEAHPTMYDQVCSDATSEEITPAGKHTAAALEAWKEVKAVKFDQA